MTDTPHSDPNFKQQSNRLVARAHILADAIANALRCRLHDEGRGSPSREAMVRPHRKASIVDLGQRK